LVFTHTKKKKSKKDLHKYLDNAHKNWKSIGPIKCLVTDNLQNIFFCVLKLLKNFHCGGTDPLINRKTEVCNVGHFMHSTVADLLIRRRGKGHETLISK